MKLKFCKPTEQVCRMKRLSKCFHLLKPVDLVLDLELCETQCCVLEVMEGRTVWSPRSNQITNLKMGLCYNPIVSVDQNEFRL